MPRPVAHKEVGRVRLLEAAVELLSERPPSALSERIIAKRAGVHHTLIIYSYGSMAALIEEAFSRERERFEAALPDIAFGSSTDLPLTPYSEYWRAYVYLVLDSQLPGLKTVATQAHTLRRLAELLAQCVPQRRADTCTQLAAAWWCLQIGALVFDRPLMRGLSVAGGHEAKVRGLVAGRLGALLKIAPDPLPSSDIAPVAEHQAPKGSTSGRGAVEEHLIEAAIDLLSERSGTGITGREVAERAGVNYGLIHHYFGSKDAVVDAAFVRLHERYLEDVVKDDRRAFAAPFGMRAHEAFLRIWAYRELAGAATPLIDLKGMRLLLDSIVSRRRIEARRGTRYLEAQASGYCAVALQLGWVLCRHDLARVSGAREPEILTRLAAVARWFAREAW